MLALGTSRCLFGFQPLGVFAGSRHERIFTGHLLTASNGPWV